MLETLKRLFRRVCTTSEIPESLWVLCQMQNAEANLKEMFPEHVIDFVKQSAQEASNDTQTLFIPIQDGRPQIPMFTSQKNAGEFINMLSHNRIQEGPQVNIMAFTLILMERNTLFAHLQSVPNLRAVIDPTFPTERLVTKAELRQDTK